MAKIEAALPVLFAHEGIQSEDKSDPGGLTKYGISHKSFPNVDIANLTLEGATKIYRMQYWPALYDEIQSQNVATKLFDTGVNCGVMTAIRIIQRALGVTSDGIFGHGTLAVCNQADEDILLERMEAEQKAHYQDLIADNPKLSKFEHGWNKRAEWKGGDNVG